MSLREKTTEPMTYRFPYSMRRLSTRRGSRSFSPRGRQGISKERQGENRRLSPNFYRDKTVGGAFLRVPRRLFRNSISGGDSVNRVFTEEELSKFNGKDQSSVLIAYDGKVYDVTTSYHWKGGRHHALHQAGQDLTPIMEESPHQADLLIRFPIVGVLKKGRLSQDSKF
jgi:predicted heme/steroid binding protein